MNSQRDLLLQEILNFRREFCLHFAGTSNSNMTDADYVLARFLLKRLNISNITSDGSAEAQFLIEQYQQSIYKNRIGESSTEQTAPQSSGINALHLAQLPSTPASHTANISDHSSIIMFYGLTGEILPAQLNSLAQAANDESDRFAYLLRASVPALWRSTSILLTTTANRVALLHAVGDFTAAFSTADLDALKLAEQAAELRATVQQLSMPGTNQGEIDRLKRVVTTLEIELAAIRRSVLQQETTIAPTPSSNHR